MHGWPAPEDLADRVGLDTPSADDARQLAHALDVASEWACERAPILRAGAGRVPSLTATQCEAVLMLAAHIYRTRTSPAGSPAGFPAGFGTGSDPELRKAMAMLGTGRAGKPGVPL
jgi:hypothetical protein